MKNYTPQKLIGSKEIVKQLSCSRSKANEILHRFESVGKLYKDGKFLRIKQSDLNDWLESLRG